MRLPTWITSVRVLLFLVILLAIVLRFTHIGIAPPGLYPDEAANGNDALHAITNGWDWFYPHNNGREGLFINLQALALFIIGLREPWVLRIVSAIIGILTVPGIYLLGRELWNRRVGLISAALLAGSFWHVVFSRIGFRAIMAPFVLVYALACLLMGLRKLQAKGRFGWSFTLLGGALAGVGLHTYIAFRAASLVFIATGLAALWCSVRTDRRRICVALAAAGVAALIVAAPLLHYFYTHPGSFSDRSVQVSVLTSAHPAYEIMKNIGLEAGMFITRGDSNWRHNDAGQPEIPLVLFLFLIGGVAYTGNRLLRTHGKDVTGITVVALVIAGATPAVISDEGLPHALRSIMLLVPVILLAALGLERAWTRLDKKHLGVAGIALATIVCAYGFYSTTVRYIAYVQRPEVRSEFTYSYLQAGRALLRRDLDIPAYVVVPQGDVLIDGIPVAAQTTMFVSGTAEHEVQDRGRVHYVTNTQDVPPGSALYDLRN